MGALAKMFRLGPKIRNVTVDRFRDGRADIAVKASLGKKLISVRNDCDGSVDCCTEVHLMVLDPDVRVNYIEVHLNYDESRELIGLVKAAMKKWRREQDAREDAELLDEQADRAW